MKLWSNNNVQKNNGGLNPERRLLAAVLQRAVTDFLTGDDELKASAHEWIFGQEAVAEGATVVTGCGGTLSLAHTNTCAKP